MSITEHDLAEQVYAAIQHASNKSERSQQSTDFRIGMSDLGFCSEKVRRMVAGIPEPVTDKLAAFLGTAIGDHVEQACLAIWPDAVRQPEVSITLHGDGGDYVVTGHPDLVLPDEGVVVDFKTHRGLAVPRRTGPSRQQQYQRHGYALGAWEAGLFGDRDLSNVQVANVWIDRAGDDHEVFPHMEPYDQRVVDEAAFWLDDVAYSYLNGQEARKEPPIELCRAACGHFPTCRAGDGDLGGLLTDSDVLTAVELYREAGDMERAAKRLKDQAKANLSGINGSTGKFAVRWVRVNGGHVEFDRQSYDKLDIRPI